jgi:hypothetical protein
MTDVRPDTRSTGHAVDGETFDEARVDLAGWRHEDLVDLVLNDHLNGFISDWADRKDDDAAPLAGLLTHNESGKRVPYIGWYWRDVDFAAKRITIADCGDFIGFCENNKWGYDQRDLTDDEADQVIALLWKALNARGAGPYSETIAAKDTAFHELWTLMQSFTIPPSPWNV